MPIKLSMQNSKKRNSLFKARRRAKSHPNGKFADVSEANSIVPSVIRVTTYDADHMREEAITEPKNIRQFIGSANTVWVDVEGLQNADIVEQVGQIFNIHYLVLEDILTMHQRAKLEQYGDNFFLVTHLVLYKDSVETRQLSLFLGKNFVVSFHNEPIDGLASVLERLRKNQGLIRSAGADYLAYSLLDAIVDTYYPVLEIFGERLEELEDLVIENPTRDTISQIHVVKRELLTVRRAIWPMRDAINALLRDSGKFFGEEARIHLRDCYDHAIRVLDFTETYRELGADLMDVYLSSISNRMNEVMKVLTIILTALAPPSLIAAIYGMNFNNKISPYNMPETNWYYGYPAVLIAMLLAAFAMLSFMRWKGWLEVFSTNNKNHSNNQKN
jgi:magnesium transporter